MIKNICNGVPLPALPQEPSLPHCVLLKTTTKYSRISTLPVYALMFSEKPFLYYSGTIIFFTDCTFKCYQAITEGDRWASVELTFTGSGTLATVPSGSTYVWCNEDIPVYPDMTIFAYGSAAQEVEGADMPLMVFSLQEQYTFEQGKTPTESLNAVSISLDEGTVSYSWRKWVRNYDGGEVATTPVFSPPTDKLGSTTYYCVVTNEKNGTRTSGLSDDVVVTIIEPIPPKCIGRELLKGFVWGLGAKQMRSVYPPQQPEEEPPIVRQSYNGVVLPALPEWDKEQYPWAVIAGWTDAYTELTGYSYEQYLFVSANPLTVSLSNVSSTDTGLYLRDLTYAQYWKCLSSEGFATWHSKGEYSVSNRRIYSGGDSKYDPCRFMWANHDVRNTSHGTVWCSASEPVLVEE